MRRTLLRWRFYHGLRTDAASPTLASDGADLAAVFATLAHIRQDTADLDAAVDRGFPGARLIAPPPGRHARFARLADAVVAAGAGKVRAVFKQDGATRIEGLTGGGEFEEEE